MLLSFPGASYVAGMDELSKQHLSTIATVVAVLMFNVIMLILLELPARVRDLAAIDRRPRSPIQQVADT